MVEDWDTTVLVFTKQEKTHQRLTIFRESCWLWKWVRWARCDNSTDGGAAENCSRVTCLQVASTGQLQLTVAMWHPWTYVAKSSNFSKKPEILIIMYNLLIFKCWQFIVVRTIEGAILQSLIYSITVGPYWRASYLKILLFKIMYLQKCFNCGKIHVT